MCRSAGRALRYELEPVHVGGRHASIPSCHAGSGGDADCSAGESLNHTTGTQGLLLSDGKSRCRAQGIAATPDAKTALVANHGAGTVSAIDIAAATVTKSFKAGTGIETLTYY
jgi:hypothetical protein